MEETTLDTVIQGGAVGVAIALIILMYFFIKWFTKIISNHINHNTEVLTELKGLIKRDFEATDRNTEVMKRVERTLDKNGK